MTADLRFSPGVGPDVAVRDGRVSVTFGPQPWTWLTFGLDGTLLDKRQRPVGYYPKTNGVVALAHDGERFLSWDGDTGAVTEPAGLPVGVHATGVSPSGLRFFSRRGDGVFTATGAYCEGVALPNPYASYGLWECRDDGTCLTWDERYYGVKPADVGGQVYATPDGRLVVGEGAAGGVVGTVDGQPFTLWPGEDTRWPRAAHDGTTAAIVAWSDAGPTVRLAILTLDELRVLAEATPDTPAVPPALEGRRLWLGYFFALSDRPGYGDNLAAPGNCTVVLTEPEAQRSPWPYFAPPGIGDGPLKIGTWVSVPRGSAWPVVEPGDLALYDGGHVLPDTPCPVGLTGLECYSEPGEPLAVVDDRLRRWLRAWPQARVILIGQAYDRNGLEHDAQKLAALQVLPLQLAVDFPQVAGVFYFSDGRPGGTRDHETWRPIHAAAAALVRRPDDMTHLDTVQAERAKYPPPQYGVDEQGERVLLNPMGNENAARISRAVAWAHRDEGWGLLDKPSGNNVLGYSVDVIINARERQVVDILGSSEAECLPVWNAIEWRDDYAARWRPPLNPDTLVPAEPDLAALAHRVAVLEELVTRITSWIGGF